MKTELYETQTFQKFTNKISEFYDPNVCSKSNHMVALYCVLMQVHKDENDQV